MKLTLSKQEDPNMIYAKANLYLAEECLDLAENLYFNLLNLEQTESCLDVEIHADIFHNLGMLEEKRHNYELAIDYYQHSVALNKKRSMTWLFLAKLHLNRFDHSGHTSDLKEGFSAIHQAEVFNLNYPVIKFLKQKYALS